MTKKKIVWLCVLAAVAICAAVWLWPRSMERVSGTPIAEVESWWFVDQTPGNNVKIFEKTEGRMEDLEELYTFRFSRPYPSWTLSYRDERVCYVELPGRPDMHVLSDGRLWVDGTWHYKLVGGQQELERLNRWLDNVLGGSAGQAG